MVELLKKADKYASGVCIDYDEAQEVCADFLLAEGVIVPLLSIGQKVYINAFGNDIQSFTVTNIYVQRDRDDRTYFAYDAEIGEGNDIYFDEEKIGNIIFLDQEEARKSLAERSDK